MLTFMSDVCSKPFECNETQDAGYWMLDTVAKIIKRKIGSYELQKIGNLAKSSGVGN
jgi:hypothetical protein